MLYMSSDASFTVRLIILTPRAVVLLSQLADVIVTNTPEGRSLPDFHGIHLDRLSGRGTLCRPKFLALPMSSSSADKVLCK